MIANRLLNFNGCDIQILADGSAMYNATQAAMLEGGCPEEYLALASTKELIDAITRKNGNSKNQIVTTDSAGNVWMEWCLFIDFMRWMSAEFRLWTLSLVQECINFGIEMPDKLSKVVNLTFEPLPPIER